jgi:ABC-type amino acid transport system permease subunit
MVSGTLLGYIVARARRSGHRLTRMTGDSVTNLVRNAPSFVILFYLAFILPNRFVLLGFPVVISPLIKAMIALTLPVMGFASDAVMGYWRHREQGSPAPWAIFWTSWSQYFIIILMATSTASVIGVPEIVSQANLVIAAVQQPKWILFIYLYTALWFLVSGILISATINKLMHRMAGDMGA